MNYLYCFEFVLVLVLVLLGLEKVEIGAKVDVIGLEIYNFLDDLLALILFKF